MSLPPAAPQVAERIERAIFRLYLSNWTRMRLHFRPGWAEIRTFNLTELRDSIVILLSVAVCYGRIASTIVNKFKRQLYTILDDVVSARIVCR